MRIGTSQSAGQAQYGAGSIWSQLEARGLDELAAARKARVEALRNRGMMRTTQRSWSRRRVARATPAT